MNEITESIRKILEKMSYDHPIDIKLQLARLLVHAAEGTITSAMIRNLDKIETPKLQRRRPAPKPPASMFNQFVEHLTQILNHVKINKTVLDAHQLNVDYANPVSYILNKLDLLYSIKDMTPIKQKDLLQVAKGGRELQKSIALSEQFIKNELLAFKVDLKTTYLIQYHGEMMPELFTVPENTIVVLLAPTNRVTLQNLEYLKEYATDIATLPFLESYIKQPGCLPDTNYCFKYASVFYPGQKCLNVEFFTYEKGEITYDYQGIIPAVSILPNLKRGLSRSSLKMPSRMTLYDTIQSYKGGIYFVGSCRACNTSIDDYLTEAHYYNEYMCNFINKRSRNVCKMSSKKEKCGDMFYFKMDVLDVDPRFPKLIELSPINMQNKTRSYKGDLKYILNKTNKELKDLFILFNKIQKKDLLDFLMNVGSGVNTYRLFETSTINLRKWYDYIEKNLFVNNRFIIENELIHCIRTIHTSNQFQHVVLKLFISQIYWYYLKTVNTEHRNELQRVFTGDIITMINGLIFYFDHEKHKPFQINANIDVMKAKLNDLLSKK